MSTREKHVTLDDTHLIFEASSDEDDAKPNVSKSQNLTVLWCAWMNQ